jgi:hypothetical protein
MVGVFAVWVDLAQGGYKEPFVDACARVGDVEIAQGEAKRQGGAEDEVLGACASRANISRVMGGNDGFGRGMSCEVLRWTEAWA